MSENLAATSRPSQVVGAGAAALGGRQRTRNAIAFYAPVCAALIGAGWLVDGGPVAMAAAGMAAALVAALVLQLPFAQLAQGAVLVATAALLEANLAQLGLAGRLWGIAAVAVCLLVFALAPLPSLAAFPLLHLFCLVQALYLLVSVLLSRRPPGYETRFSDQMRADGFALTLVFMGVLVLAGATATRLFTVNRFQAVVPERTSTSRAVATMVFGAFVSIAVRASSLGPRLGAIVELVNLIPLLGGMALVDLWIRGNLALRFKVGLVAAAVTYALAGVGTGLLYAAAGPFIGALALVVARRRRIPWALLAAVMVALVLLNAGKAEFREQYDRAAPASGIARGPAYVANTVRTVPELGSTSIAESAYRFSTSDVLGYMRQHVPERYPYWDKRTYASLPLAVVPRVIVPFKPRLDFSNEFGRQYGILDYNDDITSQNIPLSVEAYVNFGIPGLVVVAAIVGAFLAWVGSLSRASRTSDVILGALIASQALASIESGVTKLSLVVPFLFLLRPVARWIVPAIPTSAPSGRDLAATA